MLAGPLHRTQARVRRERSSRAGPADAGFSLIEVLVSLAVITISMTAFTIFVVSAVSATGGQSTKQAAVKLADGIIDQLRAQDPESIVGDSTSVTIDGVVYSVTKVVSTCWRKKQDSADCGPTWEAGATEFIRVVATVTWEGRDCPNPNCSYVASALFAHTTADPVFPPPPPPPPPATPPPVGPPPTAPLGGSVDATGLIGTGLRYSGSTVLHLALNKGTAEAGLALGARLYRRSAPLVSANGIANGTCGAFGTYTKVGSDDPAATVDDTVTDQKCWQYQYVVTDTLGDSTPYTSGEIKVDSTGPDTTGPDTAPVLTLLPGSNTYISGSVAYYRPNATSGSFSVTAAATDAGSGIVSYSFPNLGVGWTAVPGSTGTMTYSWSALNPAVPVGAQNVTALTNAAAVSLAAGFTLIADAAGPTGGSVDATALTGTGTRYSNTTVLNIALAKGTDPYGVAATGAGLQRLTAPLTSAGGTANGVCGTYASAVTLATDPVTPVADTVPDQACYRYEYSVSDNLGNVTTYASGDVKLDTTAPVAPDLVFSAMVNSSEGGGTVYLSGASGSFRVTASATDTGSGIASYAFPSLGAGWTATPGGTGVMNYSWTGGTPATASGVPVTATNNAFLNSPAATFSVVTNTAGPTGGSVNATGLTGTGSRYSTSTTLSIALNKGTDPDGLGSGLLYRATATLTSAGGTANGACGVFGAYALVTGGTDPATPKADVVADQACYRYQYVVSDTLTNQTTYTSADVKVDTTAAAAPSLALTAITNTYVSGSTVYYRSTAASGSFTVTATATDTASGILSYSLPALGTGWTAAAGGTGVSTYSWSSANPAAPGARTVTATDNAGLVSPTATFTPTADSTAPAGGSVTYTNGYVSSLSVPVTFAAGTDGGAGINATAGILQRASATLSIAGVCGAYGAFASLAVNPTSIYADGAIANKTCYQYRYLATDRVGNVVTYTSASVAKVDYAAAVDATAGVVSHWRLGEGQTTDTFTGTTGTDLNTHTDQSGYSWTKRFSTGNKAVFSNANRIRRSGTTEVEYVSSVPLVSPDYAVEADVIMRSSVSGDAAGVEGRGVDSNNWYTARYNRDGTCWSILKSVNGVQTESATYVQTLTVDQAYRLRLDVNGSAIKLYVDGVLRVSWTDTGVTGAGNAGIRLGGGNGTTGPTDSTGLHLDNFAVTQYAIDSKGSNDGTFMSTPTLGVTGAITNDPDTAMRLNGSSEYVTVPDAASLDLTDGPLSMEAWIKRADNGTGTQTIMQKGTGTYQLAFKNNKIGLYKYGTATAIAQSSATLLDTTAFHHVVATKTGATSKIYVDGVDVTAAGTNVALVNTATALTIGGSAGEWFNGTLDEVAIYNQVLSPTGVSDHYLLGTGADIAGPTGGSVDATGLAGTGGRYSTSATLSIAFAPGTDPSGMAATGRKLLRAGATLTNGACGSYGSYAQVGADDPVSPKSDVVAAQACYSYRYSVADLAANATTYTSGDVMVDSGAPAAPTLVYSSPVNTYVSGGTVYYKSGATSGSFTVTAAGTDATSGIAGYTFGSAGAGWSAGGSGASRTYSWAGAGPVTANPTITAADNAGNVSAGSIVTLAADASVPTGGAVSYLNGTATSSTVTVTLTGGSDTGSGLNAAAALLRRSTATLAGGSCGTYSAFTTIATAPASPYSDAGLGTGCYKYQYVVTDNVGNTTTYTSANVTQVDYAGIVQGTAGLTGYWRMGGAANTADGFTDTATTTLTAHTGEIGAGWTNHSGTSSAIISDANRLRKTGTANVIYYSSYVPASANYAVEADLVVKSNTNDGFGLEGRRDTVASTGYSAGYNGSSDIWGLYKTVSGSSTLLSSTAQTLTVGRTYRMRLDLNGTAIKLYVDGVVVSSATDGAITAAGRGGMQIGIPSSTTTTDTTGYHIDNFRIAPNTGTTMTATAGANGTFAGSPLVNAIGATSDFNGATAWTSGSTYADVPDSAALDLGDGSLSLEAWVRRNDNGTGMQTILQKGTGAYQFGFYNNKIGLYKYTGSGVGTIIAQSLATQTDTTAFHHYAVTKNGAAVKIYVDGADVTGTVTNQTLVNTTGVLRLGGGIAAEYLNGYTDEVAVYNQVLSAATVADHHLLGAGGSATAVGLGTAQAAPQATTPAEFTTGVRVTAPAAAPVQRRATHAGGRGIRR